MSISSVAKKLFGPSSIKNKPIDAKKTRASMEEMRIRNSPISVLQMLTGSKLLEKYIDAKIKKAQKLEEKKEPRKKQDMLKYAARTSNIMKKKIDMLTAATERNSKLIESLVSDVGSFKRQRKINLKHPPKRVRVPVRSKTVKGQLDHINEEIQKIKSLQYPKRRMGAAKVQPSGKAAGVGLLESLFGMGGKTPTSLLGGAVAALGLSPLMLARLPMLLGIGGVAALPKTLSHITSRLKGEEPFADNPLMRDISRAIDPALFAAGGYGVTKGIQWGAGKYADKKIAAKDARVEKIRQKLKDRLKTLEASKMAEPVQGSTRKGSNKSKVVKQQKAAKAAYEAAEKTRTAKVASTTSKIERLGTKFPAKVTEELTKFRKFAKLISKYVPGASVALLAYKIGTMSNLISKHANHEISDAEYKKEMVGHYGELATSIGPTAVGALIGGIAGAAAGPLGILAGGFAGANIGALAGMAIDGVDFIFGTNMGGWIGEKLYNMVHLNDNPNVTKETSSKAGGSFGGPLKSEPAAKPVSAPQGAAAGWEPQGTVGAMPLAPIPVDIQKILETIKKRESGGSYTIINQGGKSTASGAYQFVDGTWRTQAKAAGIGTEYPSAYLAPPQIQDAVAAHFVQTILKMPEVNGDVSKVPLVWFTGNAQGKLSEAGKANHPNFSPEKYQADWMSAYAKTNPGAGNLVAAAQKSQTATPTIMSDQVSDMIKSRASAAGVDPVEYVKRNFAPEIAKAFVAKNSGGTIVAQTPPAKEESTQPQVSQEQVDQAHATAIAAATASKQLNKSIGALADQVIDTKMAVQSKIEFPSIASQESSFNKFAYRT